MIRAEIEYTEETCLRLALVQDKCYGGTRLAFRILIAIILIVIAFFVGFQTAWGAVLIALSVFFLYSTNFMYERDASKALLGTPERFRKVDYYFYQESFMTEAGDLKKRILYTDLYSLVKDGLYYYLFINQQQAFMVRLQDDKAVKRFEDLLASTTGKKWKIVRLRRTPAMAVHDMVKKMKRSSNI